MKNQIINEIQRKMLPYLNNEQLLHLKAVLEAVSYTHLARIVSALHLRLVAR